MGRAYILSCCLELLGFMAQGPSGSGLRPAGCAKLGEPSIGKMYLKSNPGCLEPLLESQWTAITFYLQQIMGYFGVQWPAILGNLDFLTVLPQHTRPEALLLATPPKASATLRQNNNMSNCGGPRCLYRSTNACTWTPKVPKTMAHVFLCVELKALNLGTLE